MDKITKKDAGTKGGKSTLVRYGHSYFARIGKRGAAVTWSRYTLRPVGTSDFAMVERESGAVKALLSGLPWRT